MFIVTEFVEIKRLKHGGFILWLGEQSWPIF